MRPGTLQPFRCRTLDWPPLDAIRKGTLFLSLFALTSPAQADFIAGADCSLVPFFEMSGIIYKTKGQMEDAISILKGEGINCIRLRLFTSSVAQAQADPYDYINNLDYTVPLAVRVKSAGLKLLLDFHYSDTWADPGHQTVPSAWTDLSFAQLVTQMRAYNSNCIAAFRSAGAPPDFVQVGNEITSGILWTNGRVGGSFDTPAQWSNLGQLLNAAIQGIKDAAGTNVPKIVIHLDRGGDWNSTKWFFDNLQQQHVPFDIIGQSYYPFYHGPLTNLSVCLSNTARSYGKPIFVAETVFPWTNSFWTTELDGIPGTIDGQVQYVAALARVVRGIANGLGGGIFWWGAEYQKLAGINEAGYYTTSFFDAGGNVLPAANALGQTTAPLILSGSISGSVFRLSWPLSGAGMRLTTSTNVAPSATWSSVTNAVQTTGATFYVTIPLESATARFYRLQQ